MHSPQNIMATRHTEQYASTAYQQAQHSPCLQRHGCVAVCSGKIIGRGFNNYRIRSHGPFNCPGSSCHAEIDALRQVYREHYHNHRGKTPSIIKVV
jgi:tRNA(Arg) A34 adenosine deaminase TadA